MGSGDAQADLRQQLTPVNSCRHPFQRFGDDTRCDIAGLMPARPVSDCPEAEIRAVYIIVFIPFTGGTGMCCGLRAEAPGRDGVVIDRCGYHLASAVARLVRLTNGQIAR